MTTLLILELALVAVVFLGLPLLAWSFGRNQPAERRGLGLPRGSVRSMLALLTVGSTVNFLIFGAEACEENFSEILAVLSTLSGSVLGFYFGGRTATPQPDAPLPPITELP